jgi:hypothetical protein
VKGFILEPASGFTGLLASAIIEMKVALPLKHVLLVGVRFATAKK